MAKPPTITGYSTAQTLDCERILITLLRGLGPWKESIFLVGGLTPRYLVPAKPPAVEPHAGTVDIDTVIELQILADTDGYHTLEENLRRMGFERATNDSGQKVSWRWEKRTERGEPVILELLADAPEIAGGKVQPLPTDGSISALNIPHASIVFDLHQTTAVQAELLDGAGIATEKIKHANLVSFTCLKAFAYDDRIERKDAHDLIYCIEWAPDGLDRVAEMFNEALTGEHRKVIQDALEVLRDRFAGDKQVEGYQKDGPVAVARFELGEGNDPDQREDRLRRQREASDIIEQLLGRIDNQAVRC